MASATYSSALPHHGAPPAYQAPPAASKASQQPQGTFLPGTKVQVGSQRVVIEKYLSEGGFAHVYVVRVPRDNNKHELAVLKRVAVPDRDHLASMRTEVETMKKLKGHRKVVTYMDSHASQLKGGGYEVFLLMEYCSGGGLIDFMNTRLQHRLTEPEILKIFGDVAEGLACMHYLKPPLLHRDLKVENVLISKAASSGTPTYKLCDFGSAAKPRPAAKTAEEGRLIEEDVQKHTTMQYRSPEMIDVWRKQPIDEKADIWALGVLLYKLCYYTTPFEDVGQMAILNASYKYPAYPSFSERLKKFIGWMLKEDPRSRPNVYQVVKEVCSMRGTAVPIKDIYATRTQSEARRNESLPAADPPISSPPIGLQKAAPQIQVQSVPDIAPMRRGRPTAPAQQTPVAAKPSSSPARGDPFAALDSRNHDVRAGAVDELSKRFPSLDEFSITLDKGSQFGRPPKSTVPPKEPPKGDLNDRVANVLADEVFAQSKPKAEVPKSHSTSQLQQPRSSSSKPNVSVKASEITSQSPLVHQPTPVRPGVAYKSTGVGSSPPPTKPTVPEVSQRPIWRIPDHHHRSASQPRASDAAQAAAASLQPSLPPSQRPALLDLHRPKSQTVTLAPPRSTGSASSRLSLESDRPTHLELGEPSLGRARSAQNRSRPTSMYVNSNMDYLRDHETSRKVSIETRRRSQQPSDVPETAVEETKIDNDIDYLRSNEDSDIMKRRSSRKASGHHKKRSSLGDSISSVKNILTGRFGDAFKRFEQNAGEERAEADAGPSTPEARDEDEEHRALSPIQGSEATPSKHSDPDSTLDETEDLPPDVRRELERRRLSQEEKRVAEAAAAYRAKVMAQGTGGAIPPTRANTIQNRVQSLLDEGRQSPVLRKTAEGYGKYVDVPESENKLLSQPGATPVKGAAPPVACKPLAVAETSNNPFPTTRPVPSDLPAPSVPPPSASAPPAPSTAQPRTVPRPSVPPKSQALRTGGGRPAQWPPQQSAEPEKPLPPSRPGGLAALLAKDLEGVPDYPPHASSAIAGSAAHDNVEAEFSKRYPTLSGIEMVETEIGDPSEDATRPMRVKEV